MAGYGSQGDYEADLLQTYLRKGRISQVSRRDVDLALSIYKMPKMGANYAEIRGKSVKGGAKVGAKLNSYNTKQWALANEGSNLNRSDASIMKMSTRTVLNYATEKRASDAKAKKAAAAGAAQAGRPAPVSSSPAARPSAGPVAPPIRYDPVANYSGSLTPPTMPRTVTSPPTVVPNKRRVSPFGGGTRPL